MLKISKSIKRHQKVQNIKDTLTSEVRCIGEMRLNQKFTSDLCNTVENLIKKKYKVDKKRFVLDILKSGHDLNTDELMVIENQIEYLFNEGLIKKTPFLKKCIVGALWVLGFQSKLLNQTQSAV